MRIVYMGTPDIARVCLERLYTSGACEIAGRVLQLHRGILSWKCKQTQGKDGQAAPQDRLTLP